MKKILNLTFILLLSYFFGRIESLCVLESDFGFSVNCNFKKSGMFRVRNLGGLKAHFGLGFSLGDELGFPESLGNVEGSKKRSLNVYNTGRNDQILMKSDHMQKIQTIYPMTMTAKNVEASPNLFSTRRSVISNPQGFKTHKPPLMTEALTLPLGVPRFKKLPNEIAKEKKKISYNLDNIPHFQSLPLSTSEKFEKLTKIENYPSESENVAEIDLKGHTIDELAAVANVSKEVIMSAIKIRRQQMLAEKKNQEKFFSPISSTEQPLETTSLNIAPEISSTFSVKSTSPATHVTKKKIKKHHVDQNHKVLNAPKEYYPIGYDKNFDDGFKSKVNLPATPFHCGDQKHFPGLYADQDLNCMVFHVCALTDDGLVMKSFLCPESTLFDQTILKCNWWFYTDCKSSKSLYDSNLPVSKSYQLMKSLSFFSKHYKSSANNSTEVVQHENVKEEINTDI